MKVNIEYDIRYWIKQIDLVDYGYDNNITWESLTEDQQLEITNSLYDEIVINIEGKTI